MDFDFDGAMKEYFPLYEIGVINQNPAIKVLTDHTLNSMLLASLMVGLFETAMRTIPDNLQNEFEKNFLKSFKVLMKERHNFEMYYNEISEEE